MKRISTISVLMLLCCMVSMAQIELGNISFSLSEGKDINSNSGRITITFPNASDIEEPESTTFVLEGNFGNEELAFDGIKGTFTSGATLELANFGLEPSKVYTLKITSVKVNGEELAQEGRFALNFKTRDAERKLAWTFVIPEEEMAIIRADADVDNGGAEAYWKKNSANQRYYIHQSLKNSEIMLDANTPLSVTKDLIFNIDSDKTYIGDPKNSLWSGILCLNSTNLTMTIPNCKIGDIIAFTGINGVRGSAAKQTCIFSANSDALAPEGIVSSRGVADSIWVSAKGTYKFEAQVDGDITFTFSNFRMTGIEITEGQEKLPRNYNVVARYVSDDKTIDLKELVGKTEGTTGSTVKANYPYWLADADGNVYTHGTKGTPFTQSFDLKNGEGDTTFVVNYSKTAMEGAVFLSEGEDIQNAFECSHANAAIRASNCKAGYVLEDTKLVTLQPGTYKIKAVIFDGNKAPGYVVTLTKGEGELNEIYLSATATNWTETESDLITITEPTDIVLKAGGSESTGHDAIVIYSTITSPTITFADTNVKALCVANWDTDGDGELSEAEAAAVKYLGNVFKENSTITLFDELQYFTGLTSIGSKAFYECSGLTSITIPNSVTSIDNETFWGCI